ncbi:2-C-methyl-D-erythritol 4-phosphate cytidylyltransferase, partial [Acinetobacter nosocomialis]|uniref:2-C-methyl-D-erythritol 4-phosphate cytidylyltransferase n=1 Tax=Acinetobacter nosocomialis TaxID=106654 RepID=UPI00148F305A
LKQVTKQHQIDKTVSRELLWQAQTPQIAKIGTLKKAIETALKAEAEGFAKAAITPQAGALIGLFINDQVVKKASKQHEKGA